MSRNVHARTVARASALALLYSSDITESDVVSIVEEGAYPADIELPEYAENLVTGVSEHMDELDAKLASTSENWALDRMPVVDRAILRLAAYEMLYVDDVPVSVTINEAVELAKAYGGEDDSSRFVNGVLGRIARSLDEEPPAGEADEAPAAGEVSAAGETADASAAGEAAEAAFAKPDSAEGEPDAGASEAESQGESR